MRRVLLASAAVLVVSLAGCASEPSATGVPDEWFDEAATTYEGNPDVLGTVGLRVGSHGSEGADGSGGSGHDGVTITLVGPNRVSSVEAVCDGGGSAAVTVTVTTAESTDAVDADVPCDDATHRIDLGTVEDATSVTVDATSDADVALFAAIVGLAPRN